MKPTTPPNSTVSAEQARWWLLEVGEVICEGDEVFDTELQEWVRLRKRDRVFGAQVGIDDNPIRRRFAAQGQTP